MGLENLRNIRHHTEQMMSWVSNAQEPWHSVVSDPVQSEHGIAYGGSSSCGLTENSTKLP